MSQSNTIHTVTLPVPLPSVQPRGAILDDENFVAAGVKTFRITDEDYQTVVEAAAITGTTVSEFVRWCALYAANDVCRQHNK